MKLTKRGIAIFGIGFSGLIITINALGLITLKNDRDFFLGVFGGCAAALGFTKKSDEEQVERDDAFQAGRVQTAFKVGTQNDVQGYMEEDNGGT